MEESMENSRNEIILVFNPEADIMMASNLLARCIDDNSRISVEKIGIKKNMATLYVREFLDEDDAKTVHRILKEQNFVVTSYSYNEQTFWLF